MSECRVVEPYIPTPSMQLCRRHAARSRQNVLHKKVEEWVASRLEIW